MFAIFKRKPAPLLTVRVNGHELCRISQDEFPCEKTPSKLLGPNSTLELVDSQGVVHSHNLGSEEGWFHFSVRVHSNLACQADCAISKSERFDPADFAAGKASGIRFQPFFLSGAAVSSSSHFGKGLFARGLHFNGTVTSGNVALSCVCDRCKQSFLIRSYHAGFSEAGYFYSGSGKYTITVSNRIAGSPAALSDPNPEDLAALEAKLPAAPDGSAYKYLNPFRCPHCSEPFIDFEANPGSRPGEYYGNYLADSELLRYEPVEG